MYSSCPLQADTLGGGGKFKTEKESRENESEPSVEDRKWRRMEQTFQGAYFRSRVLDEDNLEEGQTSDAEADETDSVLTSTGSRTEDSSSPCVTDDQSSISLSLLSLGSSRSGSQASSAALHSLLLLLPMQRHVLTQ